MNMNQAPQPSNQENQYKELTDQLAQFNSRVNEGRGSLTLRLIIDALGRNNFNDAKAITGTDFDKLRQYDDDGSLQKLLEEVGLKDKLTHF
ncbi:MAG: hypothetical protein RI935_159 [Candidatus Parcubacteria bacterium]